MSDRQTFFLVNERVHQNAIRALHDAQEGFVVTIAPKSRSSDQNAMFHAICSDIAKSGHLFAGQSRKADAWKVLLISGHATATGEGSEVVPGLEGEFVNIRESSALMSVKRAASLITYCLAYCDMNGIALTETHKGGWMDARDAA